MESEKVGVLEFRLNDELYCFSTDHIDYVFDLEEYNKAKGFDKSVFGITKYNNDIIILIDTLYLYNGNRLDFSKDKSVVVVKDENGVKFGMIVDSIEKIDEVSKAKLTLDIFDDDTVINNYTDGDRIINEIYPLPLLKKHKIPFLKQEDIKDDKDKQNSVSNKKFFLLFKIEDKLYAIESIYVKEVVEAKSDIFSIDSSSKHIKGAVSVREEVLFILDINKKNSFENLIVIEYMGKKFGIDADEIFDIESFDVNSIEKIDEEMVYEGFYNYKDNTVALLNLSFFAKDISLSKKDSSKRDEGLTLDQKEFLIFYMDGKRYSIDMECVRQVIESEELATTKAPVGSVKEIEYITTWNHKAVSVLSLKPFLDLEKENNNQVIFIEAKGVTKAFLVEEIDNIAYIDKKDVSQAKDCDSIINGAIVYNDEVIVTLNENFIVNIG